MYPNEKKESCERDFELRGSSQNLAAQRQKPEAVPEWEPEQAELRAEDQEVSLVRRAADVIGSERVARWLQTSLPALNERTPLSLLKSKEGRTEIEDLLVGIEHGDF